MTTGTTGFNVPIPTDELNQTPSFLLDAGWYQATVQSGTELKDNGNGWQGIRVPFQGFLSKKDGKMFDRDRNYQITTASGNDQATAIGRKQALELAVALGLAEDTTVGGKPAKRMTASSPEEFVEQLNSVAGTVIDVYVTVKKRKRDGKIVMRDDNTGPVMDNEISRVAPYGEGK